MEDSVSVGAITAGIGMPHLLPVSAKMEVTGMVMSALYAQGVRCGTLPPICAHAQVAVIGTEIPVSPVQVVKHGTLKP